MQWMRKRLSQDDGFTLIELMVVVLIIAVLVAIAIPSFLGFRRNAQDRAAQSEVRNILLAEKGFFTENNAFTATEASLQAFEPSITLGADATAGVFVELNGTQVACLNRASDSDPANNFFVVFESAAEGTWYGTDDLSGACPADTTGLPASFQQGGW